MTNSWRTSGIIVASVRYWSAARRLRNPGLQDYVGPPGFRWGMLMIIM